MKLSKEENIVLCEKYPFLIPRDCWSGDILTNYNYEYTELDNMPDGWRKAFGEKMCEEIKQELLKYNYLDNYSIIQIKEKFGMLRWYGNGAPDGSKIHEIISKYSGLSKRICINCGKPATRITIDWISPFCDNCIDNNSPNMLIDDYFKEIEI